MRVDLLFPVAMTIAVAACSSSGTSKPANDATADSATDIGVTTSSDAQTATGTGADSDLDSACAVGSLRCSCYGNNTCNGALTCVSAVCVDLTSLDAADADSSACAAGSVTCPCYGNGTCNGGLTCASGLCVDLATGDANADAEDAVAKGDASDSVDSGDATSTNLCVTAKPFVVNGNVPGMAEACTVDAGHLPDGNTTGGVPAPFYVVYNGAVWQLNCPSNQINSDYGLSSWAPPGTGTGAPYWTLVNYCASDGAVSDVAPDTSVPPTTRMFHRSISMFRRRTPMFHRRTPMFRQRTPMFHRRTPFFRPTRPLLHPWTPAWNPHPWTDRHLAPPRTSPAPTALPFRPRAPAWLLSLRKCRISIAATSWGAHCRSTEPPSQRRRERSLRAPCPQP